MIKYIRTQKNPIPIRKTVNSAYRFHTLIDSATGKWNKSDFVLADFGLARKTGFAGGYSGTPGFGAPEQFLGECFKISKALPVTMIG